MPIGIPLPSAPAFAPTISTICTDGSYNGFTWALGTNVMLQKQDGLDDLPPQRRSDALRSHEHGGFAGPVWFNQRIIQMTFIFLGDVPTIERNLETFRQATNCYTDIELPLYFLCSQYMVMAKVSKRKLPYDRARYAGGMATASVEFTCSDPRKYSAALTTVGLPIFGSSTFGLKFPAAFPLNFGGGAASGATTVLNAGDFGTKPTISISGPCTTPEVISYPQGSFVKFNITLGTSDILLVNMDTRAVTLNPGPGQASRRNTLDPTSTWWEIVPGYNRLKFQASSGSSPSQAVVSYRSAWV